MMASQATEVSSESEGVGLPEPASLELEGSEVSRETSFADEGASEGVSSEESGGETPGASQAKSIFQTLRESDEASSAPKAEELPPEVKPGTRAAEAIVGLRQRAQRAESEHANLQQVLSQNQRQFQEWAGNVQRENQQLREQMIQLQAQLQYAPKPPSVPKSEAQQYLDGLRDEFGRQIVDPKFQAIAQRMEQLEQQNAQFVRQQQEAKNIAWRDQEAERLKSEAAHLWRNNVLREVPPEVDAPEANVGQFMILAASAANPQMSLQECAWLVRRTLLGSADLISKHARTSTKRALETGREAAPAMPRGAADGATKEGNPDMDILMHNGFGSPMDWKDAGKPRLKPLPKSA